MFSASFVPRKKEYPRRKSLTSEGLSADVMPSAKLRPLSLWFVPKPGGAEVFWAKEFETKGKSWRLLKTRARTKTSVSWVQWGSTRTRNWVVVTRSRATLTLLFAPGEAWGHLASGKRPRM